MQRRVVREGCNRIYNPFVPPLTPIELQQFGEDVMFVLLQEASSSLSLSLQLLFALLLQSSSSVVVAISSGSKKKGRRERDREFLVILERFHKDQQLEAAAALSEREIKRRWRER
jgi:hypothetical protein